MAGVVRAAVALSLFVLTVTLALLAANPERSTTALQGLFVRFMLSGKAYGLKRLAGLPLDSGALPWALPLGNFKRMHVRTHEYDSHAS